MYFFNILTYGRFDSQELCYTKSNRLPISQIIFNLIKAVVTLHYDEYVELFKTSNQQGCKQFNQAQSD